MYKNMNNDKNKQKPLSTFPARLKELRIARGMRQRELGDVLGYGYTTISNYESGRNEPSIADLKMIAEVFDVTVDYLVDYKLPEECNITITDKDMDFMLNIFLQLTKEKKKLVVNIIDSKEK